MASSRKTELAVGGSLLLLVNIIFAALAVLGQVGQNVSLPLWTGATGALDNPNCTNSSQEMTGEDYDSVDFDVDGANSSNSSSSPTMDPFFVLSFASLSFVVIFGSTCAVLGAVQLITNAITGRTVLKIFTLEDDLLFPQWQLILIGVFDALNGVFVVFASMPSRTAPFLQAILGNFTIPLTIFFR